MSNAQIAINRTLILGLGDAAVDIIGAFHARLNARLGFLPDAGLGVGADDGRRLAKPPYGETNEWPDDDRRRSGLLPDQDRRLAKPPYSGTGEWPIATLAFTDGPHAVEGVECIQIGTPEVDRPELRLALDDHIDEITAGITTALARISELRGGINAGIDSSRQLRTGLRSTDVDVYLVAALDDRLAGVLIDIAYLVRQVIRRRLNSQARITGLLLLPDTLTLDDPEPALARTHAVLKTVDAYMDGHDGYRRPSATGSVIEGWGPAFDGDCFLIGALTQDGLRLSQPDGRTCLVAEMLVQLTATATGRALLMAEPLLQQTGSRPGYAGLGLASLVYPAHALRERLARRLARQVLETWAAEPPKQPEPSRATAFLADNGLDPESARELILAPERLVEAGVGHPIRADRPWGELDALRDVIDDAAARRLERLNAHRAEFEDAAEALAGHLAEVLETELVAWIDAPEPAALKNALAFVRLLKDHVCDLERRETENADRRWDVFQALSEDVHRTGEALAEAGARAAACRPTMRGMVGLIFNPHRWFEIWHTWQRVHHTKMTYLAHMERQIQLTVEILQSDLLTHYLGAAVKRIEHHERKLSGLLTAIKAAASEIQEQGNKGIRGQGDKGAGNPGRLISPQFDLEWSVVSSQQARDLYHQIIHDPADELSAFGEAQGPLSDWLEAPDAVEMGRAVLAFARHRFRSVLELTIGQWLAGSETEPGEAIQALLDAAVPFLAWDETALRAGDGEAVSRTCVLGMPAADAEYVEAQLEALRRPVSPVRTADEHRLVALTLARGIPLAAVPALVER